LFGVVADSPDRLSESEQPLPSSDGDGLRATEDVEFSEQRFHMGLNGQFRNREVRSNQLVGLALSQEPQDIDLSHSQFLARQALRKLGGDVGRDERLALMNFPDATE